MSPAELGGAGEAAGEASGEAAGVRGTRRDWWAWAAAAAAALASGCSFREAPPDGDSGADATALDALAPPLDAVSDAAGDGGAEASTDAAADAMNDVPLLNNLRAAELNKIVGYDMAAAILASPPAGDPLAALGPALRGLLLRFREHHAEHTRVHAERIRELGGTPIADNAGMYRFPATFTPSVRNVLRLAADAERRAAVAYTATLRSLRLAPNRFLVGSIGGNEAQHFVVFHALVRGLAQPGPNLEAMAAQIVQTSCVSTVGSAPARAGLQTIPAFTYA